MKKRAQASTNQIFVYILSLIVVALVVVFGYSSITNLLEQGKESDYLRFQSELTAAVILSRASGDINNEIIGVPSDNQLVCFTPSNPAASFTSTNFPLIENSIVGGVKKNVFFIGEEVHRSFYVEDVEVLPNSEDLLCAKVFNDMIQLRLEGEGDQTTLSSFTITETMCENAELYLLCGDIDALLEGFSDYCCSKYTNCCP